MKECKNCKLNKEESDFSPHRNICKKCSNEKLRTWYDNQKSLPKLPLDLNETKKCYSCKKIKSVGDFPIKKDTNRPYSSCKECKNIYYKEQWKKLDPKKREEKRQKYKKHWKYWNDKQNEKIRNGDVRAYISHKMPCYKISSKKYNLPYDLDLDYLVDLMEKQNRKCYYTGQDLSTKSNRGLNLSRKNITLLTSKNQASLDRLEPDKGYVKGNVVWCGWMANTCKSMLTEIEFYDFCKQVVINKRII